MHVRFLSAWPLLSIVTCYRVLWFFLLFLIPLQFTSCQASRSMLPLNTLIPLAWEGYQQRFIDADGRVVRPSNEDDTVSEGQAYALLMAVALDDRETFDRVLNWTTKHLSRFQKFGDHLLAWHWEMDKGVTDWNSAADAEVDMALALFFAHARWKDETYNGQARLLLQDILDLETEVIGDKRYLLPGNWHLGAGVHPLNPSYFSPAHFRLFFAMTGDNRWDELLRSTYTFLSRLSHQEAIAIQPGLVPDWIGIDPVGNLSTVEGFSQNMTWDAVRMPWRVALDVLWGKEDCGVGYVRDIANFFEREWKLRGERFFLEYNLEGMPLTSEEHIAAYAMVLPALQSIHSPLTSDVLHKVQRLFHEDGRYFQDSEDYYQNSLGLLSLLSLRSHDSETLPSLIHEFQNIQVGHTGACASPTSSHQK